MLKNRFLRKVIAIAICLTVILVNNVYAQDNNFAGGKGTLEEPYQIKTAEQLDNLRNFEDGGCQNHYCLMNDIDLSEFLEGKNEGWLPITSFCGHLHGNGYKIWAS